MGKRVTINTGDIFRVDLDNGKSRFLQYVMLDPSEMNSEVVRIFKYESKQTEEAELKDVVKSGVDFYVHVVVKLGIQLGIWTKVGNLPIENGFEPPRFRDVTPITDFIVNGQVQYCETDAWVAWQAGQEFEDRKTIGKLNERTEKYYLGGIISPYNILKWMKEGANTQPYFT